MEYTRALGQQHILETSKCEWYCYYASNDERWVIELGYIYIKSLSKTQVECLLHYGKTYGAFYLHFAFCAVACLGGNNFLLL